MQGRVDECMSKNVEKRAFDKIKTILSKLDGNNQEHIEKLSNAAIIYFEFTKDTADPVRRTGLPAHDESFRSHANGNSCNNWTHLREGIKDSQMIGLITELSAEAINRDMIEYITTGKRGSLAGKMYKALK